MIIPLEVIWNSTKSMLCSLRRIFTDRKSTRLNSSHTVIYTLSLHDALPISGQGAVAAQPLADDHSLGGDLEFHQVDAVLAAAHLHRSEEHTSELQSHSDLHSFPTRRSSDLWSGRGSRAAARR